MIALDKVWCKRMYPSDTMEHKSEKYTTPSITEKEDHSVQSTSNFIKENEDIISTLNSTLATKNKNDAHGVKVTISSGIDVDEALELSGSFGRFQYLIITFIYFFCFTFGHQFILTYFTGNDPPWKCLQNNSSKICQDNFGVQISSEDKRFTLRCKLNRSEWTYTTHKMHSFVTEFDLVCEKTAIASLVIGVYSIGGGIGVLFLNPIADRYGRKLTLLLCLSLLIIASIASSYVTGIVQLSLARSVLGATASCCYSISFVYMSEFIPLDYRAIAGSVFAMGYVSSEMVIDLVAYYCRYWRKVQLYSSFPCVIALLLLFISPKSPRWLYVNRKKPEAENVLKMIGKVNGHPLTSIDLKISTASAKENKYTYLDLVRNRRALLLTLSMSFIWMIVSLSYYAISFESSNLGGNMYQAFALSTLSEIPSKLMTSYTLNRVGRKKTILISLIAMGIFAVSTTIIPNTFSYRYTVKIILLMVAKFFADTVFISMYMWSFEIFPTILRLQGIGICFIFERIGSIMAPFLASVLHQFNPRLPYVFIMVFAFSAAAGGIILPETNGLATRETYEDFVCISTRNNSLQRSNDNDGYQETEM